MTTRTISGVTLIKTKDGWSTPNNKTHFVHFNDPHSDEYPGWGVWCDNEFGFGEVLLDYTGDASRRYYSLAHAVEVALQHTDEVELD